MWLSQVLQSTCICVKAVAWGAGSSLLAPLFSCSNQQEWRPRLLHLSLPVVSSHTVSAERVGMFECVGVRVCVFRQFCALLCVFVRWVHVRRNTQTAQQTSVLRCVCQTESDLVHLCVRTRGGGWRGPEREKTENLMVVSWPFPCSKQSFAQEFKAVVFLWRVCTFYYGENILIKLYRIQHPLLGGFMMFLFFSFCYSGGRMDSNIYTSIHTDRSVGTQS